MKSNPPTYTSLVSYSQENEWRKHGTAGVNESFNVRVEINKRPDLPLWPKEHQGNLEWELTVTASLSNSHKRVPYTQMGRGLCYQSYLPYP